MTFSDDQWQRAEKMVDLLSDQLGPHWLAEEIDGPLDQLLDRLVETVEDECTPARLHEQLAEFVRVAYGEILPNRRRLSRSGAAAEAIWLLERYNSGGYDEALADASCGPARSLRWVLGGLVECIKLHHRQLRDEWVETRFIKAADWITRCAMAAVLIDRLCEYMPEELADCSPEQLAGSLMPLLRRQLEISSVLPRIKAGRFGLATGPNLASVGHAVQAPLEDWPAPEPRCPR